VGADIQSASNFKTKYIQVCEVLVLKMLTQNNIGASRESSSAQTEIVCMERARCLEEEESKEGKECFE
jgi:hypothetical protein